MISVEGKYTTAQICGLDWNQMDNGSYEQLKKIVNHPAFTQPVRVMPDTHMGKGSCIGFTMPLDPTNLQVIPNVVGVDIGCGMMTIDVNLPSKDKKLIKIEQLIKDAIPTGKHIWSKKERIELDNIFRYQLHQNLIEFYKELDRRGLKLPTRGFVYPLTSSFEGICEEIECDYSRFLGSIGTLGGGNHFIELGTSRTMAGTNSFLTVHTGSRKFGESICRYHQKIARERLDQIRNVEFGKRLEEVKRECTENGTLHTLNDRIKEIKKDLGTDYTIDIKGMEILSGDEALYYLRDMILAQTYAWANRRALIRKIMEITGLGSVTNVRIDCAHNYIDLYDWTIRKGAIQTWNPKFGNMNMIIPFNMEEGMLICEGKRNDEWNNSAPHGAGRVHSRKKAKEILSMEEFEQGMKKAGVITTSVCKATLDESKKAYKSSKLIEQAISPVANILHRVKPVINIKDTSEQKYGKKRTPKKEDSSAGG